MLALLLATAAAFAVTEHLKLQRSPIAGPMIDRIFSPVCRCERRTARVGFTLRRGGRISVAIADRDGDVVRTLVSQRL